MVPHGALGCARAAAFREMALAHMRRHCGSASCRPSLLLSVMQVLNRPLMCLEQDSSHAQIATVNKLNSKHLCLTVEASGIWQVHFIPACQRECPDGECTLATETAMALASPEGAAAPWNSSVSSNRNTMNSEPARLPK